ncbi:MAG: hypothetical protein Q7T86_01700 [Hyphomicrobiaceae bacterium]|nr:hypothetical protein [Hyphomicrobiaceae bacterium]
MTSLQHALTSDALDSSARSLLLLVYEEALMELRKSGVVTTQDVRNAVAAALLSGAIAGERNSFVLLQSALAVGMMPVNARAELTTYGKTD